MQMDASMLFSAQDLKFVNLIRTYADAENQVDKKIQHGIKRWRTVIYRIGVYRV